MKNTNIFSSLVLAVIVNFSVKPAWLLTENWVQDRIGHSQFGLYGAILSFAIMFMPLLDLGINQYFVKKVARQQSPKLFSWGLTIKLILGSIYAVVVLGIGVFLGYTINYYQILLALIGYNFFITLIDFLRSFIKAFQYFKLDAFFSLADKLMFLPLVYLLLPENAKEFAFVAFTASSSSFLIYFIIFLATIKPKVQLKGKSSFRLLRSSIAFGIMNLIGTVYLNVGKVYLERLGSSYDAGLFIGGSRWVFAAEMYIWTLLQLFFARFALYHNQTDKILSLLKKGLPIVGLPMLWTFAFMLSWGEKLLFLFKHSSQEEIKTMALVMKIMASALLLNGFFNIFSTYLTSNGYEKLVNKLLILGLIVHITLNMILVPYYGAVGVAVSFIAAMTVNVMGYILLVHFKTPMKVPYRLILKTLFVILTHSVFVIILKKFTTLDWYLQAIIQFAFLIILSFTTGFLRKDFYKI